MVIQDSHDAASQKECHCYLGAQCLFWALGCRSFHPCPQCSSILAHMPTNPHNILVQISSAHSLFIEPALSTHCRLVEGTFMQRKSYLPLDRSRPMSPCMTWPAKCTPEFTNPSTFCLCSVHKPHNHIWQACP